MAPPPISMASPPTSSARRAAFTLVELVVVMGILIVILALTIPAMSHIGKARSLATSGSKIAQLATFARQNAMSKNVLTALVLLTEKRTEADYRAFTVIERGTEGAWRQIYQWEGLGTGVVVDAQDTMNCTFLDDSPTLPGYNPNHLVYHGQPVSPTEFACRIYVPSGGLSNPDKPAQIRLVEGFLSGKESNRTVDYTTRKGGGTANFYDIAMVGTTGAVKITRP